MNFNELGLNHGLSRAISHKGYSKPSEIQEKAIPAILGGKDIMAQSRTGTGKTAAFSIPLIEMVAGTPSEVQVLVLVPTRELAVQVSNEVRSLSQGMHVFCLAVFGGQSMNIQDEKLRRGQHIVVATPGRLMDFMERGWIDLGNVRHVVLDEADKMFDMGFRDDIDYILSQCRVERQTLLFSATISDEIKELAARHMKRERQFINVSQDTMAVDEIDQFFMRVEPKRRVSALANLITTRRMTKCLVFCRTQRTADWLARDLNNRRINARAIHGGMKQKLREKIMEQFKADRVPVLVSTNLVARGLQIDNISHIINFDFPQERETYIHRIGRTARFGNRGEAITFCTNVLELQELDRIRSQFNTQISEMRAFG